MRRVILESPFAGDVDGNIAYARRCVKDCLARGEAPIASHLLFPGILHDALEEQRALGIQAGLAWLPAADAMVVYTDRGVSTGMRNAMMAAKRQSCPIEFRQLEPTRLKDDHAD